MPALIKTHFPQQENLNELGRAHSEKLQGMGRALVSGLYMLIRSVKMYEPENAVFEKPLTQLQDLINQIVGREQRLELTAVGDSFYLNNMLIKVDLSALDNVRYLRRVLAAKDVGGVTLEGPVQLSELRNFIWIFSKEQVAHIEEDGAPGRKLVAMKLARFSKLKERLNEQERGTEEKVDRKKYAMTVYARAVFFLRRYLKSVRENAPIPTTRALRIVQDLVDLSFEQKTHFLGMTTAKGEADYLVFHQVNVCLFCIVFGGELGLTRAQLRDLGYIALFHDVGMALLPDTMATKKGVLTQDEKAFVHRAPLVSVRNILLEKGISRTTLTRVVATHEHKQDYGAAVRDARGNIQLIIPRGSLGVYARILAICDTYDALTSKRPYREAYGPEVALMLMLTELRYKFDPELLTVFMRVMAIQPVRILSKREQTLNLSGV